MYFAKVYKFNSDDIYILLIQFEIVVLCIFKMSVQYFKYKIIINFESLFLFTLFWSWYKQIYMAFEY